MKLMLQNLYEKVAEQYVFKAYIVALFMKLVSQNSYEKVAEQYVSKAYKVAIFEVNVEKTRMRKLQSGRRAYIWSIKLGKKAQIFKSGRD